MVSLSVIKIGAIVSLEYSLVSDLELGSDYDFGPKLHVMLLQLAIIILDPLNKLDQLHQGEEVCDSSLSFQDFQGLVYELHLNLSKFIPFVQPLHRLQSLLAVNDLRSLLGIEESSVQDVLVDLRPDAVHVLVLAGDECIASNMVYASTTWRWRLARHSKMAVLSLISCAGLLHLGCLLRVTQVVAIICLTKSIHVNHLVESKVVLRLREQGLLGRVLELTLSSRTLMTCWHSGSLCCLRWALCCLYCGSLSLIIIQNHIFVLFVVSCQFFVDFLQSFLSSSACEVISSSITTYSLQHGLQSFLLDFFFVFGEGHMDSHVDL